MLAWGYIKPLRMLFPQLHGVLCKDSVCVEEQAGLEQATEIYNASIAALSDEGISLNKRPTFIYCSTPECYGFFGGTNERAISYPFLGTVLAPASWQRYITQHEHIHWFQFDEIGIVATMNKPEWFREGMAYIYSDAPQTDIPEHYLAMIQRYRDWHADKSWAEVLLSSREL